MIQVEVGNIPDMLLKKTILKLGLSLPFKCRGISITKELIKVTMECLNEEPLKTLPQNCRQVKRVDSPDGLDLRIKNRMGFDLRTANIISDILAEGIRLCHTYKNPNKGRTVKATQLKEGWTW